MKKVLPKQKIPQTSWFMVGKKGVIVFPSIFRFITEPVFLKGEKRYLKLFLTSFVSGFLLIAIILQTVTLYRNILQAKMAKKERDAAIAQVKYLESIAQKYSGYRDIYYQIATLDYKLGNTEESKKYLKKALEADPNFKAGRVLGEKVGF